jgi:FMN-dependent NADH-azoreductase
MSLLRIESSVRGPYSSSRELADIVERRWLDREPDATVVTRDLGADVIPADFWAAAVSAQQLREDQLSDQQRAAKALAAELYDELAAAETVILATGLYNWGVNQYLKAWIDLVFTDSRSKTQTPVLQGKQAALVVARGGFYGAGAPKEGWDHQTAWLERILGEVWGAEVTVVEREFTLVGVNPALDEFREQGAQLHTLALEKAHAVGEQLATAYAARTSA